MVIRTGKRPSTIDRVAYIRRINSEGNRTKNCQYNLRPIIQPAGRVGDKDSFATRKAMFALRSDYNTTMTDTNNVMRVTSPS